MVMLYSRNSLSEREMRKMTPYQGNQFEIDLTLKELESVTRVA